MSDEIKVVQMPEALFSILSFHTLKGEEIRIDLSTGRVTIPEGMDLDEASRAFWDAVGKIFPLPRNAPSLGGDGASTRPEGEKVSG